MFRFLSVRFSGKGKVDVYRMCMCMCFIVSIPCHTSQSMCHDVVACKAILSLTPQFDNTLTNKGYNVTLGTPRYLNDYVKYVTINRTSRSITIFQINGGAELTLKCKLKCFKLRTAEIRFFETRYSILWVSGTP